MKISCPKCTHLNKRDWEVLYPGTTFVCDNCGTVYSIDLSILFDSEDDFCEEYDS